MVEEVAKSEARLVNSSYFEKTDSMISISNTGCSVSLDKDNPDLHIRKNVLEDFMNREVVPNLTFSKPLNLSLSLDDGPYENSLAFCKKAHDCKSALIPDFYAMCNYHKSMWELTDPLELTDKINKMCFFGVSTGSLDPIENKRLKLCNWSVFNKDISDCYISHVVQIPEQSILKNYSSAKLFLLNTSVSLEDQLKYRYIIDIDGNVAGWNRYFWIARSNSVPLKLAPVYECWYHRLMHEYEHYIPVESINELRATFLYCNSTLESCKQVSKRAKLFTDTYMTIESHRKYTTCLFEEIAERTLS